MEGTAIVLFVLGRAKALVWDGFLTRVAAEIVGEFGKSVGRDLLRRIPAAPPDQPHEPDAEHVAVETRPPASEVRFKGLRSFDEHDADFFPKLLPGDRGEDGLPASVRFWKTRIEQTDPERTFRVGVIFGPSGCGKSSLMKAGILPRLTKPEAQPLPANGIRSDKVAVVPVLIDATADDTETRLLRSLRRHCPELPPKSKLLPTLREKRNIPAGKKILIVLDQFEQWLHSRPDCEKTELAQALTECDGQRVQCVLLVRDDFWTPLSRFLKALDVRQEEGRNLALVDRFDLRHAKRVLVAFGQHDGMLSASGRLTRQQTAFVRHAVTGLAEEGKIICVRLVLFAQMVKGKPWTPATLKSIGGVEKVGVAFLRETFSDRSAPVRYRRNEESAQTILRALLPERGATIKGAMKSRRELLQVSGYARRPHDFDELLAILNSELRLIAPTHGPESEVAEETQAVLTEPQQYYQLTHDYLVNTIRDWLRLKQTSTRRGKAELRLEEMSAAWTAKPENRHLPSLVEWANIRLLARKAGWTDPERTMMNRAGRVHGFRGFLTLALLAATVLAGIVVRRQSIETQQATHAADLVERLLVSDTPQVPGIVAAMRDFRKRVDTSLRNELHKTPDDSREKLHASLALLPVDAAQVPFLEKRLLVASPSELPVLRAALKPHQETLVPKLWSVLESAHPGDPRLLPVATALAEYDATSQRWELLGSKVAQALIRVNPAFLGAWLDTLRPVRTPITTPVAAIFRSAANLLMDADPKTYAACFAIAQYHEPLTSPLFQAEIARKLTLSWNDPPLDPSWTTVDPALTGKIESAQGMLTERFAFCQAMPLDEFLATAEALRKSGYRPTRFRPYALGNSLHVAAVWTRDGRPWRIAHDQTTDEICQTDVRHRKEGYLPCDVAGYPVAASDEGKTASRCAALWVQRAKRDDDARIVLASSAAELAVLGVQLQKTGLFVQTLHAWPQADSRLSYSSVWHMRQIGTSGTPVFQNGLSEEQIPSVVGRQFGSLADLNVAGASPPPSPKERATLALQVAEAALKANPDDQMARLNQASARLQLGENQKVIDDLDALIKKSPELTPAYQYRAIAHARLGRKDQARVDREKFEIGKGSGADKLYRALVLAAELDDQIDVAFDKMDAALKNMPRDADLHYDAACAYALASEAIGRKDKPWSKSLGERAITLLGKAIKNGYADYRHMQEDADLDPIRDLPAFAEIMKRSNLNRSYSAVWAGDVQVEAIPLFGVDLTAHLARCREMVAQEYRMVALSVARTSPEGPPIAASVWHRPLITDETRDRLAERQARGAVALLRMGKADEIVPLLRHSADPRLRSFIINWLSPLGADPRTLAAALERLPSSAQPAPAKGVSFMNTILFHSETSQRRALILALGTFGTEGLSPGEQEPLIRRLLDLYRDDPDSGVHAAAEWTLRQWKDHEKLEATDAGLRSLTDPGDRRWYVNSQGQTFALIEGPLEFEMGSPPTETDRSIVETAHRILIPHRFAIAAKEVTNEQYRKFVMDTPKEDHASNDRSSSDPKGPMNCVTWYDAAAYCNWLSQKENLPVCYEPNEHGKYASGMRIKADAVKLPGYRLPTEAEWEYACRAGAATSHYYGSSKDLLQRYALFFMTYETRILPCGSLLPNDLGCSDMLGNVWECCQDEYIIYGAGAKPYIYDNSIISVLDDDKCSRIVRGGSFMVPPTRVRSACRQGSPPAYRSVDYGFRPARTYP